MTRPPTVAQVLQLPVEVELVVPEEVRDSNGHMNVQYFHGLHTRTTDSLFARLGFPDPQGEHGVFGLESRISHHAEVGIGHRLTGHARLLACDGRLFHGVGFLINHDIQRVATSFAYLLGAVDLQTRRIAALPEAYLRRADEEIQRGDVGWPPPTFDPIGLKSS